MRIPQQSHLTGEQSGAHLCANGPDSHGYYPNSGGYGLAAYLHCQANRSQIWSGNVWDDNDAPVDCP